MAADKAPRPDVRAGHSPVQVIAVTGGKGGVGKTTIAVNLATSIAARGKQVMLLDGDLGLANVDVFLGLTPRLTLTDVLAGGDPDVTAVVRFIRDHAHLSFSVEDVLRSVPTSRRTLC